MLKYIKIALLTLGIAFIFHVNAAYAEIGKSNFCRWLGNPAGKGVSREAVAHFTDYMIYKDASENGSSDIRLLVQNIEGCIHINYNQPFLQMADEIADDAISGIFYSPIVIGASVDLWFAENSRTTLVFGSFEAEIDKTIAHFAISNALLNQLQSLDYQESPSLHSSMASNLYELLTAPELVNYPPAIYLNARLQALCLSSKCGDAKRFSSIARQAFLLRSADMGYSKALYERAATRYQYDSALRAERKNAYPFSNLPYNAIYNKISLLNIFTERDGCDPPGFNRLQDLFDGNVSDCKRNRKNYFKEAIELLQREDLPGRTKTQICSKLFNTGLKYYYETNARAAKARLLCGR